MCHNVTDTTSFTILAENLSPLAEGEGFKPPIPDKGYTGFRVQRIRSLCQPSLCDCHLVYPYELQISTLQE